MSRISRRHFLQFAGSTLATLGLSQHHIIQQGNRYAQVLAQTTPRKLALLVGINQYPNNKKFVSLNGCSTDVFLQRELLIHKFGFNPSDIIFLTSNESASNQPTRQNILQAFEEHLIKQVKPGDVVVFHFSGHGSRLLDPKPIQNCSNQELNDEYNSTLVPGDEGLNGLRQDIMGSTLFLLISALKTENVTAVLDSCYSGGGTRGNFIVRSRDGDNQKPSPEEISYQERWMQQLQMSESEFLRRRCDGVRKGVVLAAAQRDEEAYDAPFDSFSAGAFTYLLTQYLWQETDTVKNTIVRIGSNIKWLNRQKPLADGNQKLPVYSINKKVPPADAVITEVKGEEATLWLGGIDNESLVTFGAGATFSMVNDKGQTSGKLQLESREGLTAKAKLVEKGQITSLKPGMLLQESKRVVPADLKLRIGLDPSLAGEINVAKEKLSEINRIETIPAQRGNKPYSAEVEYIFSRMTADYQQRLQQEKIANIPAVGTIGLFTAGLEVVPESFGESGEKVTAAVSRLEAKLKSSVAVYIIKKTLNGSSSTLDVEVLMNLVEEPNNILAQSATLRGKSNSHKQEKSYPNKIPLEKLFQFRVTNNDSRPLHLMILLIDPTDEQKELNVIFPYQGMFSEESMRLEPNQTKQIGGSRQLAGSKQTQLELKAKKTGTAEMLFIFSLKPLTTALKTLQSLAAEQKTRSGDPVDLKEPVDVIGDLLADLSGDRGGRTQAKDVSASEMATLPLTLTVV
ncbi:peptidase C14 [Scytonema sp. UIC 10036]|nr:peptidase C14 [Scytonema sp. UIC 10036]